MSEGLTLGCPAWITGVAALLYPPHLNILSSIIRLLICSLAQYLLNMCKKSMLDQTSGQPSSAPSGRVAKTSPETEINYSGKQQDKQQDKTSLLPQTEASEVSYCRGISLFHSLQEGHWGWWGLLGSSSTQSQLSCSRLLRATASFDCLPGQSCGKLFRCLTTFPLKKVVLAIFRNF